MLRPVWQQTSHACLKNVSHLVLLHRWTKLTSWLDGAQNNPCTNEAPWQSTSLATRGMGGDMFWQWGDTLSYGQSNSDPYTVWYNSSNWQCLVQNHVTAINGGTTTPPPASSTTTTSSKTTSTASSKTTSTASQPTGNCSPLYGQCGGIGWAGATCCAQGTCRYGNDWYSQCVPS